MNQDEKELVFKALSTIHKETDIFEKNGFDLGREIDEKLGEIQSEKYD